MLAGQQKGKRLSTLKKSSKEGDLTEEMKKELEETIEGKSLKNILN